jgi:SAM-dependent methyltransferase
MNHIEDTRRFVCPVDKSLLARESAGYSCRNCGIIYPVINDVPILINDRNSVFQISDYASSKPYEGASGYGGSVDKVAGWRRVYRRLALKLCEADVQGDRIDANSYILARNPNARILVIGCGDRGHRGNVTYTDVAFAKNVCCIADAHDLPFENESFDAVFADSVLEHVCDPQRCVSEITRVLAPRGYVMATTPFLQSVHMGAHDFTRFTYLGHRRLFRQFDDIESGMCGGPGYAAIHMLRNLAATVTDQPRLRSVMRLIALLITYPIRYIDPFLSRTQSAYNTACATYFFGQKRDVLLSDREIIAMFRGR